MSYDCPHCGANDSGHCDFRISVRTDIVVPSKQVEARNVGCRVMHYTDLRVEHDAEFAKSVRIAPKKVELLASYRQLPLLASLQAADYPLAPGPRGTDIRTISN